MQAIQTRSLTENDKPFIFSSWLKHYKNRSYFAKRIRNSIFYKWHHIIIENILDRPATVVMVAHPEGEPDVILGFIVGEVVPENSVVHFVYVKPAFKRMGIAKHLFKKSKLDQAEFFTHWTFDCDELLRKLPNIVYDPYRI